MRKDKLKQVVSEDVLKLADKMGMALEASQAIEIAEDFLKSFGIFVGFYNKVNGTTLSVAEALESEDLLALFRAFKNEVKKKVSQKKSSFAGRVTSTSFESLQKTDLCEVDQEILAVIQENPGLTRPQIAARSGRLLQTVCGSVSRLKKAGLILQTGRVYSPETDRMQTTLVAKEGA